MCGVILNQSSTGSNLVKKNEKFVENRIKEIRKNKDIMFGYVNAETNPADIGTRGCKPNDLKTSNTWWEGPRW